MIVKRRKPGVPVWKTGDGSRTLGRRLLARAVGNPYPRARRAWYWLWYRGKP